MVTYYIIGNFGNHSIALAQWAIENITDELKFIAVDTGWAAREWSRRVDTCKRYLEKNHIEVCMLNAKATFADMVRQRGQFPSQKFQWCAGFLKGLAINDFLDEHDPLCQAYLVFGKRKSDSRVNALLSEYQTNSEHYNDRTLWYPLLDCDDNQFHHLIKRSGMAVLAHRSLECQPCIHSSANEIHNLNKHDLIRLNQLEEQVKSKMFPDSLTKINSMSKKISNIAQFDMGCGSPWGCGE